MYLLRTNKYVQPDEWEYIQNKPAFSHLSFFTANTWQGNLNTARLKLKIILNFLYVSYTPDPQSLIQKPATSQHT